MATIMTATTMGIEFRTTPTIAAVRLSGSDLRAITPLMRPAIQKNPHTTPSPANSRDKLALLPSPCLGRDTQP